VSIDNERNLQGRLAAVEGKPALELGTYVYVNQAEVNGVAGPHLFFDGANVHIRSGHGSTADSATGLGNLIIGYNEEPSGLATGERGGAHNVILGSAHRYGVAANGGIVHGSSNTTAAANAATIGGDGSQATGLGSVVVGGIANSATAQFSSVFAGEQNIALARSAAIVGGSSTTQNIRLSPAVVGTTPMVAVANLEASLVAGPMTKRATGSQLLWVDPAMRPAASTLRRLEGCPTLRPATCHACLEIDKVPPQVGIAW
jgi:hypothetical protein